MKIGILKVKDKEKGKKEKLIFATHMLRNKYLQCCAISYSIDF